MVLHCSFVSELSFSRPIPGKGGQTPTPRWLEVHIFCRNLQFFSSKPMPRKQEKHSLEAHNYKISWGTCPKIGLSLVAEHQSVLTWWSLKKPHFDIYNYPHPKGWDGPACCSRSDCLTIGVLWWYKGVVVTTVLLGYTWSLELPSYYNFTKWPTHTWHWCYMAAVFSPGESWTQISSSSKKTERQCYPRCILCIRRAACRAKTLYSISFPLPWLLFSWEGAPFST